MMILEYFKPENLEKVIELKQSYKDSILFLAGGTEINSSSNKPERVIDLQNLDLNLFYQNQEELVIGSMVTIQELIESKLTPKVLKDAASYIINRNIRNSATIGGNIATNKSCSNIIPALIICKAKLTIYDGQEKILPIEEYICKENKDLILNIKIPAGTKRKEYVKKFSRTANDISIITAAVSFEKEEKQLQDICIAVGGVSKHVIRLETLENELQNGSLPEKTEIESMVQSKVNPISDIRGGSSFKKYIAGVLVSDCFYEA